MVEAYGKLNFNVCFPQRSLKTVLLISFLPGKLCLMTLKHSSNSTSSEKHFLMTLLPQEELIHVLCTHLFPVIYHLVESYLYLLKEESLEIKDEVLVCISA